MRVHVIVDFMFLYYKYNVMLKYGRLKNLSVTVDKRVWNGDDIDKLKQQDMQDYGGTEEEIKKDISCIYYTIKEIEQFRRKHENNGNEVTVSVCFDAPSPERKQENSDYKSNRNPNRLGEQDFNDIAEIKEMLALAGYNVYWREGTEADDLIYSLCEQYKSDTYFDYTVIYTPDADIVINIDDRVAVNRYKSKKGYTTVTKDNYKSYLIGELGAAVEYNSIMLYKSICGDKSDNIAGIKGFGPAKFMKLREQLIKHGIIDWSTMKHREEVENALNILKNNGQLTDGQYEEAISSLELVVPKKIELEAPVNKGTKEKRVEAYSRYDMKSLYE